METVKNFVVGSFGKVAGFVKGLGRPTKIGAAVGAGLVVAAGVAAHFLIKEDESIDIVNNEDGSFTVKEATEDTAEEEESVESSEEGE